MDLDLCQKGAGVDKVCNLSLDGTVSLAYIKWTGSVSSISNQLILKPILEVAPVYMKAELSINVADVKCEIYKIDVYSFLGRKTSFEDIVLYDNN